MTVSSQRLLMPEGVGESIKVDKSLLSAYSPGMRRIRNAFMKTSTYRSLGDKDIYILFLTTLPMQGEDIDSKFDGYMPYGKQFGFIRSTGIEVEKLAWAAAHELGHGAFSLQHVWLEPGYSRDTANLMGYTTSSELFRWQWEQIHHPQYRSNYLAEVDDLGAKSQNEQVLEILESIRCLKNSEFDNAYISSSKQDAITTLVEYGNGYKHAITLNRKLNGFYLTKNMVDNISTIKSANGQNVFYTVKSEGEDVLTFKVDISNKNDLESYYFNGSKTFANAISIKLLTEITTAIISKDQSMLIKSINKSSLCVVADLSPSNRCKAISILASSKVNEERAECIMKIMHSFRNKDDKAVLLSYFENNSAMFKICIDTDSWIDNNLYQRFCSILLKVYLNVRGQILAESLASDKVLELRSNNRFFIWRKNFQAAEENPRYSNIWYKVSYQPAGIELKQGLGSWIDAVDGDRNVFTRPLISYFEPVVVSFETKPSFLNVDSKQIALPAFAFAWMCSEQVNGNIKDVADVMISLSVFSSAINASLKILQAKKWIELTFKYFRLYQAALNLGNATLVVGPSLEERLSKTRYGENFLYYFKSLGTIDSYSGVISDLIIDQKVSSLSTLCTLWQRAKDNAEMQQFANSEEFKNMDELINNLKSAVYEFSR